MSIFDDPIMIDGKEVGCKPPEESELIDLERLCPWLARPNQKKSQLTNSDSGLNLGQGFKKSDKAIIYNFFNHKAQALRTKKYIYQYDLCYLNILKDVK